MLLRNAGKCGTIKPSGPRECRAGADGTGRSDQRAAQPLADRRDKALLGPKQHFGRQVAAHRLLHQPFALPPAQPQPFWQGGGKFDQPVIEQGLARFQTYGHRGAVHLGQDIPRQPEFEIGVLRPVQSRPGWRTAHERDKRLLGPVIPPLAQKVRRIQPLADFGRGKGKCPGVTFGSIQRE